MSDLKVGDKVYIKPDFYKNNKSLVMHQLFHRSACALFLWLCEN